MTAAHPLPARSERHSSWILPGAAAALVLWAVNALPPEAGEPGVLRWLRTCSDHPVRSVLAAVLLGLALRRRGPAA